MRTSGGGKLWPHNDGTGCASCSGAYQKMMFPWSNEINIKQLEKKCKKLLRSLLSLAVLSQHRRMNHNNSYVQTFMFRDISDKT